MERFTGCTYNIENGGFSSYSKELSYPKRLNLIKETISDLHADFVGIVDAYRWNESSLFPDVSSIATYFEYKNASLVPLEDIGLAENENSICVSLLSNFPCESVPIRLYNRNALKSTLHTLKGDIDVFVVYLDYNSEEIRLKEMNVLLEKYVEKNKKTIIMGDFNTLSPHDRKGVAIRFGKLFKKLPLQKYGLLYSIGEKLADQKVIPLLENEGFVDVARYVHKNKPTLPTKKVHKGIFPILRLDYCFVKEMIPEDAEVVHTKNTDIASDHYPLVFSLTIEDD
jgi:hypothetical protein